MPTDTVQLTGGSLKTVKASVNKAINKGVCMAYSNPNTVKSLRKTNRYTDIQTIEVILQIQQISI